MHKQHGVEASDGLICQARQAEDARVSLLVRALVHDLNNSLDIALGYAEIVQEGHPGAPAAPIVDSVKRMASLLKRLRLIYCDLPDATDQTTDMAEIIEAIEALWRSGARLRSGAIELRTDLSPKEPFALRITGRPGPLARWLLEAADFAARPARETPPAWVSIKVLAEAESLSIQVTSSEPLAWEEEPMSLRLARLALEADRPGARPATRAQSCELLLPRAI